MTRDEVLQVLHQDNPTARADEIVMYADCFMEYIEARENIQKNGSIVTHPRTGAPLENPYNRIKISSMEQLRKVNRLLDVHRLWDDKPA